MFEIKSIPLEFKKHGVERLCVTDWSHSCGEIRDVHINCDPDSSCLCRYSHPTDTTQFLSKGNYGIRSRDGIDIGVNALKNDNDRYAVAKILLDKAARLKFKTITIRYDPEMFTPDEYDREIETMINLFEKHMPGYDVQISMYAFERRLEYNIGCKINDGVLIRFRRKRGI